MYDYVVLDIETQRLSDEVDGGWNNIPGFGLAIAVLMYSDGHTAVFDEGNCDILISELALAHEIVTFNGIRFDYEVLRPYGLNPQSLYPKSFDILSEMEKMLGHRVSLENVAYATLDKGKTGDGKDAVKWYKAGKIEKVIKYCRDDVAITKQIFEYIVKHGYCYYTTLQGVKRPCQL